MTDSTPPEPRRFTDIGFEKNRDQNPANFDLRKDPDYIKLLELYQNGEFEKCQNFVSELERRYPGHPEIRRIKENLELKLSLKDMKAKNKMESNKKKAKATFNLGIFAIGAIAVVIIALILSLNRFSGGLVEDLRAEKTAQINSVNRIYAQAEDLLQIGQPQPAAEIIKRIKEIDPDFENLPDLEARTEALLALEAEYQQAVNLFNEGKRDEALLMFRAIEEKKPGMWDVRIRIDQIETDMQIESSLQEGNAAYQVENWELVISAYENAMRLDPSINDPSIKEQLLRAYLNKIILMLQSETASNEDIENAEQYYRKAISLIPQNREYSSERINLEEVSTDLLKKKFSQLSEALLADKSQTSSSINKAVSYLRKSVNFDPKNTAMQSALKNAEYYQVAFQHFSKSEWVPAINNLTPIYSSDQTFAGGNANILLFESYYFLGKQYYSFGFYQDALKNLEQAEIVAWSDTDNLLRLFRLQILLGDTYAELENYENAVSYYRYAMNAINIDSRLANKPAVETKFADANAAAENEAYENAYTGYRDVLADLEPIYVTKEVEISDGICLALFASENQSMTDAILEANNLSNDMIISFGRTLFVPTIEP